MNEVERCEQCDKIFLTEVMYLGICPKCSKDLRQDEKAELQGKGLCELPYIYEEGEGHYFDY